MKRIITIFLLCGLAACNLFAQEGWFTDIKRDTPAPQLAENIDRAFVIPIRGAINDTLVRTIENKIIQCKSADAQIIIFDMDTPGGAQTAMDDIVNLITADLKDIYTVAYVNPEAISAGAIISLACTEITMARGATIGDAMPIMIGTGGIQEIPKAERGKIESYIRGKVRALAQRNGHSEALCEAMVTLHRRVWLVQNKGTGELLLVDPDDKKWEGRIDTSGSPQTQPRIKPQANGELLEWKLAEVIDRDDELVTLTTNEAVRINFVKNVFADMGELRAHYSITAEPVLLEDNWSQRLVAFLTSPVVSGILLMAGIFFLYIEANTPGLGLPGGLALVCFAVLFGSRFLIGLANWWEIGLFAVGVVLLIVEIFVLPGFGVAGVAGILCCLIALLAMAIPNSPGKFPIPQGELEWKMLERGITMIVLGLVGGIAAAVAAANYLPKIPFASKLILAPVDLSGVAPVTETAEINLISVGDTGIVEATCRPVGRVRFGDVLCDATADGEMIPHGTKVKIIHKEGNHIIVEPLA